MEHCMRTGFRCGLGTWEDALCSKEQIICPCGR